jgi:hypothetical protein
MKKLLFLLLFISSNAFAQSMISGIQVDVASAPAPNSIILGTDTTGDYVSDVIVAAGGGVLTTGASSGADVSHTLSVDQSFSPTWTGTQTFSPSGTNSVVFNIGATAPVQIVGTSTAAGTFLCLDGSNNVVTCDLSNSIALGTDTTGNYVATATAGTNISITGSGTETAAITVATVNNPTFSTSVTTPFIGTASGNFLVKPAGVTKLTVATTGDVTAVGNLAAANLSGTNTGDVTLGTANGLTLTGQALSLPTNANTTLGSLTTPTVKVSAAVTSLPTCNAGAVGTIVLYDNSAGAVSLCGCEQQAGPAYAWGAMTSTGICI